MERYLVISSHTLEDCQLAIDHFKKYNAGFLTHFEWGCYDNDHNAYAFIEADSHQQALLAVPPFLRNKARAIKVVKFSPAGIKENIHSRNS